MRSKHIYRSAGAAVTMYCANISYKKKNGGARFQQKYSIQESDYVKA